MINLRSLSALEDCFPPTTTVNFLILQKRKPADRQIFWILENEKRISIDYAQINDR